MKTHILCYSYNWMSYLICIFYSARERPGNEVSFWTLWNWRWKFFDLRWLKACFVIDSLLTAYAYPRLWKYSFSFLFLFFFPWRAVQGHVLFGKLFRCFKCTVLCTTDDIGQARLSAVSSIRLQLLFFTLYLNILPTSTAKRNLEICM